MKAQGLLRTMITLLVFMLLISFSEAQWPADPDSNLIICDHPGGQVIPKVAPTSDGGCYISWYDAISGNYNMYLQHLNNRGEIMWGPNGILISDHRQDTWLTDYSLIVDHEDYAVVVFNDIRSGDDWDIYAYRVSPDGELVWGDDGLTLSDNDGFEPFPQVAVTSSGNIAFAWQDEDVIHLRKVTPDGIDCWTPSTITLTGDFGLSVPRLTKGDNDEIILQMLAQAGPNYYDQKYIYAQKFDSQGTALWGDFGAPISTAGGIAFYMFPNIISDGFGGAYSFWYDTRNVVHHAYVQHVLSNGTLAWTANGERVRLDDSQLQMNISLAFLPTTGDVLAFYLATGTNQAANGIQAQKFNAAGERQWTDDGIELVPLADLTIWGIQAFAYGDGAIVTYFETPRGDVLNSYVKAMRVDGDGNQVWETSPVIMCTHLSEKLHLDASMNCDGQVIDVWESRRNDPAGDIYLQNVNPDGTLGEFIVGIENNEPDLPVGFALLPAYPNPFNASTLINYNLNQASDVTIEIYDLLGRKLETLSDTRQQAGLHQITWNAGDRATGVYFYKIQAGQESLTEKLLLLK
jgi:hypothetical protein